MNNNLLIVGAGIYALVAMEIAKSLGSFGKIDFIDDNTTQTPNGIAVIGTTQDIESLADRYGNIVVAIGNPEIRLSLLEKFKATPYRIATLISPRAYVSPSAQIMSGCIIEPMAVVHAGCIISEGCIISAGAVVNHATTCCSGVHVDCNATVEGYCLVPAGTKICSGEVYKKNGNLQNERSTDISKRAPMKIDGLEYTFESGM